ncbi:MAG: hypothetical protein OXU73_01485 [Candidatus Campbellbacteria bacterium]|nr:hypothetical protein [Candidatus Campbellbacteria bacterium]
MNSRVVKNVIDVLAAIPLLVLISVMFYAPTLLLQSLTLPLLVGSLFVLIYRFSSPEKTNKLIKVLLAIFLLAWVSVIFFGENYFGVEYDLHLSSGNSPIVFWFIVLLPYLFFILAFLFATTKRENARVWFYKIVSVLSLFTYLHLMYSISPEFGGIKELIFYNTITTIQLTVSVLALLWTVYRAWGRW